MSCSIFAIFSEPFVFCQDWLALQKNFRSKDAEYSVVNSYQSKFFAALELIEKLTLVFYAVREIICSDIELENLNLNTTVLAFHPSALYYLHAARQRLMWDADRILRRMRTKRLHDGYRPVRREYLHHVCCDLWRTCPTKSRTSSPDGGLGLTMLGSGHGSDIRLYLEGKAESSVYCIAGDSAYSILPDARQ
jgi:hypothetical protein